MQPQESDIGLIKMHRLNKQTPYHILYYPNLSKKEVII